MKALFFFSIITTLLSASILHGMEKSLEEQKLLADSREQLRRAMARNFVINNKREQAKEAHKISLLHKLAQENEAELNAFREEYVQLNSLAQQYPTNFEEATFRMQVLIQKSTAEIEREIGKIQK